jgi:hypothetical protein
MLNPQETLVPFVWNGIQLEVLISHHRDVWAVIGDGEQALPP